MNQLGVIFVGIAVIILAFANMAQNNEIRDLEARIEQLEAAE